MKRYVHDFAIKGFGKNNVHKYILGRPEFPIESINQIKSILNQSNDTCSTLNLLELGSGTGKFTKSFINNIDFNIKYTATEPSDAFRASLRELSLSIDVLDGTGENIPKDDNSMDAILVAQAFHWMANDKTLKEVKRVLKPNKPFILIWNALDLSVDWIRDLELELLSSYFDKSSPRYLTGEWKKVWTSDYAESNYTKLKYMNTKFSQQVSERQVIDRILSVSAVSMLDEKDQRIVEEKVKLILRKYFPLKPMYYEFVYSTDIAWAYSKQI